MMNIEPKFEPKALSTNDWPDRVQVCSTPGVSMAIFSNLVHHLPGSLVRRGVGQLHVDQQIAHVLLGMNRLGSVRPNPQHESSRAVLR